MTCSKQLKSNGYNFGGRISANKRFHSFFKHYTRPKHTRQFRMGFVMLGPCFGENLLKIDAREFSWSAWSLHKGETGDPARTPALPSVRHTLQITDDSFDRHSFPPRSKSISVVSNY